MDDSNPPGSLRFSTQSHDFVPIADNCYVNIINICGRRSILTQEGVPSCFRGFTLVKVKNLD